MSFFRFPCACSKNVLSQVEDCQETVEEDLQKQIMDSINGRGIQNGETISSASNQASHLLESSDKNTAIAFLKKGLLGKELHRMDFTMEIDSPEVEKMNQNRSKYLDFCGRYERLRNVMFQVSSKLTEYEALGNAPDLRKGALEREINEGFQNSFLGELKAIVSLLEENSPLPDCAPENMQLNLGNIQLNLENLANNWIPDAEAGGLELDHIKKQLEKFSSDDFSKMFNQFDSTLQQVMIHSTCSAIYDTLAECLQQKEDTVSLDGVSIDALVISLGLSPQEPIPRVDEKNSGLNLSAALDVASNHTNSCMADPFVKIQKLLPKGLQLSSSRPGVDPTVGAELCQKITYQQRDGELIAGIRKAFPVTNPNVDGAGLFGHVNLTIEWNFNRNESTYTYNYEASDCGARNARKQKSPDFQRN